MSANDVGLEEKEIRVTAVPVGYLKALRFAMFFVMSTGLIVLVGMLLTFMTVRQTLEEQRASLFEHRQHDRQHICFSALDHLNQSLHLRAALKEAGLRAADRIDTELRPEVKIICAHVNSAR